MFGCWAAKNIYLKSAHSGEKTKGVPEVEEKKKDTEKIFKEIIVENFPNMGKEIVNKSRKHRESYTG